MSTRPFNGVFELDWDYIDGQINYVTVDSDGVFGWEKIPGLVNGAFRGGGYMECITEAIHSRKGKYIFERPEEDES